MWFFQNVNVDLDSQAKQVAMASGRCNFHGGKNTEPRTEEGLGRMEKAKNQ